MRSNRPKRCGVLPLALLSALSISAFAAPTAGATVTSVTITANTLKTWDMFDYSDYRDDPINERTFSGTVDAGASAGDTVDVSCFDPASGSRTANIGSATVTSDKKWTLTETIYPLYDKNCRIAAVPSGTSSVTAGDLASKYKGSKLSSIGYFSRSYRGQGGIPHAVFTYDYEIDFQSATMSSWYMYSIGSCGLCTSKLADPTGSTQPKSLWGWNSSNYDGYSAFPTKPSSGPDADPLMQVDGKLAMDVYMAYNRSSARKSLLRFGSTGDIDINYTINQANGDLTVTETQPLYRCVDVTDPSQWRSCTVVTKTGVNLRRVVTVTADHAIWRTADTYASTDGKAHSVRATYVNRANTSTYGYRYGTSGAYAAPVKGDKSGIGLGAVPGNAFSVLGVKYDVSNATVGYDNPLGDIIMKPRPDLIRVLSDGDRYVYPRWALSVPKGGASATVKQAYTIANSDARLTTLRNTAIAGLSK